MNKTALEQYKKTKFGLVPSEWNVLKLSQLIEEKYILGHLDGNHGELYPRSHEFVEEGVPYLSANTIEKGKINFNKAKFLTEKRANEFKKGIAHDGDVLFAHNATVGPVALLKSHHAKVILSTTLTYYRCNKDKLLPEYLVHFLQSPFFTKQYERVMKQSTRNQLPITTQRDFFHIVPKIKVQNKIASILSIWDKAIELKEKLIEQKKEQKKGLMQKLLTGELRLPGFEKEWGKFRIKEVCIVVSGGTPSTNEKIFWDGNIPWCTPTDITSSGKFISNTKQKITEKGLKNSSANLLPKNSILMCSRATIGPRSINSVEMATNQGFKSFVCNEEYLDYEFFYYLLSIYIPIFKRLASGSTFLEVSKKDVENTKIFIPKDVEEQKAIGSIIGNLDKAIELLEEENKELKQQKRGLMQLLLTGKVRVQV